MRNLLNPISLICYMISFLLLVGTKDNRYSMLFVLPFFYGFFYGSTSFLRKNKWNYIVLCILFVTSFMRYVIVPFIMYLGDYSSNAVSFSDALFKNAIILMAYEEIIFFIALKIFAKRVYDTRGQLGLICQGKGNNNIIIFLVILVSLLLITIFPELITRFHFVPNITGNEESETTTALSGGVELLIRAGRNFLILLLLSLLYQKYQTNKNNIWIILSAFLIGVNSLFVHDFSRFGILIPAASFVYLIIQLYPKQKWTIIKIALVIIGAALIYTSFIKMFSEYRGGAEKSNDVEYWSAMLQTYFQGVSDVVIGLASADKIILSPLLAFINDAISNIAILSSLAVEPLRSLIIYNYVYSDGVSIDKILPNVCAGYYYFGFLGAPIILTTISYIGMKFDVKSRNTKDINMKYIYIYAAITCSMPHMIFYTMTIGALINTVFFMWIFIKLNSIVVRR